MTPTPAKAKLPHEIGVWKRTCPYEPCLFVGSGATRLAALNAVIEHADLFHAVDAVVKRTAQVANE